MQRYKLILLNLNGFRSRLDNCAEDTNCVFTLVIFHSKQVLFSLSQLIYKCLSITWIVTDIRSYNT